MGPGVVADQEAVDPGAFREEKMFDFRRWHTLPVIANAHLQPLSFRTDHELEPSCPRRGIKPVLDRILYQRLEGERWH